jgi:ubiquinone/menaquinone biosynthesis C-methylase UbiE
MDEQTWWNNNINFKIEQFKNWVGNSDAESKIYMAKYLKTKNYTSLLDAGCANATFNDTLKKNNINLEYTGVDSCQYFIELNRKNGLKMIDSDIRKISVSDNSYDIVFSRHTFEHQPNFDIILDELIRISSKEICHIFFIKPKDEQIIKYDEPSNLYHNIYSKILIEEHLLKNKKVKNWIWIDINENECALHVYLS